MQTFSGTSINSWHEVSPIVIALHHNFKSTISRSPMKNLQWFFIDFIENTKHNEFYFLFKQTNLQKKTKCNLFLEKNVTHLFPMTAHKRLSTCAHYCPHFEHVHINNMYIGWRKLFFIEIKSLSTQSSKI